MRLPIQYAFSYPERWPAPLPSLDLARAGTLEFDAPGHRRVSLSARWRTARCGAERSLPVVLNAANEVAVARFLDGRIGFTAIPQVIEQTMDAHRPAEVTHTGRGAQRRRVGPRVCAARSRAGVELKV